MLYSVLATAMLAFLATAEVRRPAPRARASPHASARARAGLPSARPPHPMVHSGGTAIPHPLYV